MPTEVYLSSVKKTFLSYKSLGEKAMAQLEAPALFIVPEEGSNSIAMIVQHLAGNMISRWTNFLVADGEKVWRNRDAEFEVVLTDHQAVMQKWGEGWACLINTLDTLKPVQLEQTVFIRSEPHTVLEAINRQLSHYPYHIGQIVYAAKILKGKNFQTLSIAPNQSATFNTQKFGQQK